MCFLRSKFSKLKYTGSLMIMVGAGVACVPAFLKKDSTSTTWYSALVFFAGILPSAFSNVYKEKQMKDADLDAIYLTCWVATLQVILGFAFMPLLAIPGFGGVAFDQFGEQITDGWRCFVGLNSRPGDDCEYAPWWMTAYVLVNFAYNLLSK